MKRMWLLIAVLGIGFAIAPPLILHAPLEETMGLVQKIFYFHVPCALAAFVVIYVCGVASIVFLWKKSPRADAWAIAGAEVAVLLGALTLLTGSLWARKAWGVWWTWDARLTTFALGEMLFVGYLLVRAYGGPGSAGLAAGLAVFGCLDVPIIYKSVSLWRTLHPKAEVVRTLDPAMRPAFYVSLVTIFGLAFLLLWIRLRVERARQELEALHVACAEAGWEE